jgi:hypothetical protein
VAVSPPSMRDIKDYLAVRPERYKGSTDDTDYVFLTKVNNEATPLIGLGPAPHKSQPFNLEIGNYLSK